MDWLAESRTRRFRRRPPGEPALLPGRRHARHAGRRAAGHRAGHHHRDAAAADLQDAGRSASLIMLSGIYYGAHHAGSTTAIMLNMPGEPSSVVICLDGHPMARQGRAGAGAVHLGARLVLRRLRRRAGDRAVLAAARRRRAGVRRARIRRDDRAGAGRRRRCCRAARSSTTHGHGGARPAARHASAPTSTPAPMRFTFGISELADGRRLRRRRRRAVRVRRDHHRISAAPERRRALGARSRGLLPTRADLAASWQPILRGTALGARARHPARHRAADQLLRLLRHGAPARRATRRASARARSRASPGRKRPTTPPRSPISSRC